MLLNAMGSPYSVSLLSSEDALAIADESDLPALMKRAAQMRDEGHSNVVTYSRKVFLPLTHLCRDTCHYCTFAKTPRQVTSPYMTVEETVATAAAGAKLGCTEALFTLGDRPEDRYAAAKAWLADSGFASTLHYVA